MSAGGKKRHLLGNSSSGGGGARKKATISPSHERPYSLRSFLKPMDRVAVELDSGDEGKQQPCEPVDLEDSAEDESDAAVCFKRKRSLRLKNQLSSLKPEETTTLKANAVGCSKRRRADASQKHPCEQDREPSVILAWKHWCMYEEDGEEIDVLVNKRDERRRLERKNEPLRQEQKQIGAADSTKIEAPEHVMSSNNVTREEVKDDSQNLVVTESGASHVDKRAVVSGDLRSLTGSEDRGVQVVSGEGAEGSNTPAGIDSKLRKSPGRDSDIEIASASVPADRLGGLHSRASSTQALIIGDQQTDPSFFSAQEDSMVLDTIAEGVAAITSYESISQSTLNDICTKGKAIHESGTSYCGRHGGDALIVDLDEQQDGTAVEKLDAGDSTGAFGVPDSVPESSNQQHPPLTSEQDWGQSSGSAMRHQVQEEQGESIGEPNEVAQRRRSKQKVVELSDEEEDSNRVSIERRVLSGQHSHHGLTRSYGGATTSGAEISSVDVAAARFATSRHPILAEHLRLVNYDDTDGGTVESNAPFQASVGVNDADLDAEQVKTYRRRRSRNQGKAIAGEDSGEEVRGPTTRQDGETSDVDSHEGQLGGELPPAGPPIFCPVCDHELEPGMSNERINDHIDKCLRRL